jgi:dihydroflavonol-4-reductase
MNRLTYIITGAGGHLGSTILRELMGSDAEIRALLYGKEEPVMEQENIHYFHGDVAERQSLLPLFQNLSGENTIVIHTAAVISIQDKISERMYRTNVEGVRNIADLCIENHVRRLVHVSSVHAIPELPRGMIQREVSTYDPDLVVGGYAKTKATGADIVIRHAAELDAVIVLPSGIIGPYDLGGNHLIQMSKDYICGRLPVCVKGGYDFVDVRDAAIGCLMAAEKGRRGESYILSGHYIEIQDMLKREGKMIGRNPPAVLPLKAAEAALPLITWYCQRRETRPLYTAYSLYTLSSNAMFSHAKAERELGYHVRSIDSSLRDMIDYLESHCTP